MTSKEHEIMMKRKNAAKQKGLKNLSVDQKKALQRTFNTLAQVSQNITDIQNLYLSDFEAIERSFWALRWSFDLVAETDE